MSLETILCGWLVFIDFDVTMATNFDKHFYSENEKSFSFITVIVTTFMVLVEFPHANRYITCMVKLIMYKIA